MRAISIHSLVAAAFSLMLMWLPVGAIAQSDDQTGLETFPNLSLGEFGSPQSQQPATFVAEYHRVDATTGKLSVSAKLAPNWYIYSVTQAAGGPKRTALTIQKPAEVKLTGAFVPDAAAHASEYKAWPGLKIEEHHEKVTWTAPISLPESFRGPIEVSLDAQVCDKVDGNCVPLKETLVAKLQPTKPSAQTTPSAPATASPPPAAPSFRDADYVVQWTGRIEPAVVAPGQRANLILTATPDEKYHVYAAAVDDSEASTNFVISEKSGLLLGTPAPDSEPVTVSIHPAVPPLDYHTSQVSWSLPIVVPQATAAGEKKIEGSIAYQACEDGRCLAPRALKFSGVVVVAETAAREPASSGIQFASAPFAATLDAAAETKWVDQEADKAEASAAPRAARSAPGAPEPTSSGGETSAAAQPPAAASQTETKEAGFPLPLVLAMALGGGLILNLMPCVLPVVGLKVMAFAEQAGESRLRVLMLNLWYTLGILVVFWALAATALVFSFSWGEQYTFFNFRFAVILLVFAMALSFLGVWEIPIPGFVAGSSTQKLQRREGVAGAFFKGIFTTILATPCSGPLLGPVFGFLLGQSATVTILVFTAIGLGMASPYLLVAIFPSLLAFIPRPGAWMDTFKQLLGFLLLGTVVYLFSIFGDQHRIPVFASLIGVWFGCWLIGLVPHWANIERRVLAWTSGLASAALVCFLAFRYLAPGPPVLAWEPYDEFRLKQLQSQGRTVLIDFTAKWCPNCIVNYEVAINTPLTSQLVDELDAVPMLADWTDNNVEIKNKLIELDSNSIPVLAIYPGSNPQSPIVLRDLITQGDVLDALRKAGSSVSPNRITQVSTRNTAPVAVSEP